MRTERWSRLAQLARRASDAASGATAPLEETTRRELDGLLAAARRTLARRRKDDAAGAWASGAASGRLRADGDHAAAHRRRYGGLVGESAPMQALFTMLDKVVDTDSTVLVEGENGTGKELVARAIHRCSTRRDQPFVAQNCSAWNDELLGSELFGHAKGAFTGALVEKRGLFDVADGGTFFLDEIGDTSPALQVKLLRVLQEGTFSPVGSTQVREVDVRIIAATNRDLAELMAQGRFREDLYYRINVIRIVPPPLRQRRDDIPLLVSHFLREHVARLGRERAPELDSACLETFSRYRWPGNVRELENEIERLVVLAEDSGRIDASLLSARIVAGAASGVSSTMAAATASASATLAAFCAGEPVSGSAAPSLSGAGGLAGGASAGVADAAQLAEQGLPRTLESVERDLIDSVLRRHAGNKTRAARELRISRRNLIRKVQKYQLDSVQDRGHGAAAAAPDEAGL